MIIRPYESPCNRPIVVSIHFRNDLSNRPIVVLPIKSCLVDFNDAVDVIGHDNMFM